MLTSHRPHSSTTLSRVAIEMEHRRNQHRIYSRECKLHRTLFAETDVAPVEPMAIPGIISPIRPPYRRSPWWHRHDSHTSYPERKKSIWIAARSTECHCSVVIGNRSPPTIASNVSQPFWTCMDWQRWCSLQPRPCWMTSCRPRFWSLAC